MPCARDEMAHTQARASDKYDGHMSVVLHMQAVHPSKRIRRCAEDSQRTALSYSVLIGKRAYQRPPILKKAKSSAENSTTRKSKYSLVHSQVY